MMLIAAFTESPEQIENFLGGCITGNRDPNDPTGQNCTTLTLTKAGFQINVGFSMQAYVFTGYNF